MRVVYKYVSLRTRQYDWRSYLEADFTSQLQVSQKVPQPAAVGFPEALPAAGPSHRPCGELATWCIVVLLLLPSRTILTN